MGKAGSVSHLPYSKLKMRGCNVGLEVYPGRDGKGRGPRWSGKWSPNTECRGNGQGNGNAQTMYI